MKQVEVLYRRYSKSLVGYILACRYAKDRQEAEDIIHYIFLRLMQYVKKYNLELSEDIGLLITMIKQYVINRSRSGYSRTMTRQEIKENDAHQEDIFMMDYTVLMDKIKEDSLSPYFLDWYNGMQYEEIAEKYGLPLGTVKSRIHFFRQRMIIRLNKIAS